MTPRGKVAVFMLIVALAGAGAWFIATGGPASLGELNEQMTQDMADVEPAPNYAPGLAPIIGLLVTAVCAVNPYPVIHFRSGEPGSGSAWIYSVVVALVGLAVFGLTYHALPLEAPWLAYGSAWLGIATTHALALTYPSPGLTGPQGAPEHA